MWSAIRSDLKEFVSTVADDTSNVLSKLDDQLDENEDQQGGGTGGGAGGAALSDEEREAARRRQLEETYTSPLLPPDEEGDAEEDGDDDDQEDLVALREYVEAFELDESIQNEYLELYGNTLKPLYERLVVTAEPQQVTEREFWMRYFWRCDADRIADDWDRQEKAVSGAGAAVSKSLLGVRSLLGGAVNSAVAQIGDASAAVAPMPKDPSKFLFDTKGRPPFVMNTAVDEDDDDEEEEEEELGWDDDDEDDDEEGGDDDQDEEEEEEEEEEEHIEFQDAATEQLRDEYRQAIDERDQLHETVAMQAKQLAELLQKQQEGDGVTNPKEVIERLQMQMFEQESELAAVKTKLTDSPRPTRHALVSEEDEAEAKATESDAAAASAAAAAASRIEELEREGREASEALAGQEAELSALRSEFDTAQKEWAEQRSHLSQQRQQLLVAQQQQEQQQDADNNEKGDEQALLQQLQELQAQTCELEESVQTLRDEKQELETNLAGAGQTVAGLEAENASLQQQLQQQRDESEAAAARHYDELESVQSKLTASESLVESLREELEAAAQTLQEKEAEVEAATAAAWAAAQSAADAATEAKLELVPQEQDEDATGSHESPATESHDTTLSGVKVEAPPTVTKLDTTIATPNDAEDDWGDDW